MVRGRADPPAGIVPENRHEEKKQSHWSPASDTISPSNCAQLSTDTSPTEGAVPTLVTETVNVASSPATRAGGPLTSTVRSTGDTTVGRMVTASFA